MTGWRGLIGREKVVLQSEAAECGLACLAMVLSAHGAELSLAELRQRFSLSLKGVGLHQLITSAQQLGLEARPLRVEPEDLKQLTKPSILHWDMNHFVVLERVDRASVTISDPASGRRKVSLSELSERFTGVALELRPSVEFKPMKADKSLSVSQLTGRVKGLGKSLLQIVLLSLSLQVFVVLAPMFMQWVVDQVLVSADRDLLTILVLAFGLALLLEVAISLLRGWSVVYLSSRLGMQWMGNVFAHALRLPLDFFEKRHLGDIVSRMGSVQAIQQTLTRSFVEALIDGLMAAVTLVLMLAYSWKLTIVTLAAVALYLAIRLAMYGPLRDGTEQQLVAAARQETYLLESLRGMQSLKVAGGEPLRRAGYGNLMVDTINRDIRLAHIQLGFSGANRLVFGFERIVVIWIGATITLQGAFSVGMLIAYLAYKEMFSARVSNLIDVYIEFRMLRLHGERLSDIVLTAPEHELDTPVLPPPEVAKIEVDNLSFRYGDGDPWVLKECSFTVDAGESVAIIGPSGGGKTTLVKLLLGLLKPTEGTIRFGGQDLHRYGPRNLRPIIGAVMQDDQLFAGSVADNISFFDSSVDYQRVESAARLAALHQEIVLMPMGYHTLIGDMGSSLSGGQKQRVILARALYRNPKVLLLDEATSHLDVANEKLVNEAVRELNLTKVIVAHRPETIASADRVLVLEGGRTSGVVNQG